MRRALVVVLLAGGMAVADESKRYEGAIGFSYPATATVAPATDVVADIAVQLEWKALRASVLASGKRVPESEVEALAEKWHAARIKNRAAWGMRANGGPPRESVRVEGKRWVRWRDRIGSVLGAQEQTMTCGGAGGRLACVVVTAPQAEREGGDRLAQQILSSLAVRRGR